MTEDAAPPTEPAPAAAPDAAAAPEPPAKRPVRLASIVGSLAAAALCAAWFLPWLRVDDAIARDFHATVEREIAKRETRSAGAEEFLQIAEAMVAQGALRGTDLIHWLRASQTFSSELDAEINPGVQAEQHLRRLRLVQYLLYGIPLGAFLLLAHFLIHRFRRARAPVLILANMTGGAAVVTAFALDFSTGLVGQAIERGEAAVGIGWWLLVAGGSGLIVAGVFGVRVRNWWRVYFISAATAAALGVLALRYLETGGLW